MKVVMMDETTVDCLVISSSMVIRMALGSMDLMKAFLCLEKS